MVALNPQESPCSRMRETEWWLKDSVPTLSSQLKPVDDWMIDPWEQPP
jgi:hypothetical protein